MVASRQRAGTAQIGGRAYSETMIPEGVPRERRSRLASVRRSAARAPRAAALLRPGPYRAGWLVVLIPAFVLLVGARTAPALPRSSLPATFDGAQALAATDELVTRYADRSPGSAGDAGAAEWVAERLRAAGADVTMQNFRAPDADGRTVPMTNVLGVVSGKGQSRDALVFIAGRDDPPPGPGANDNGSGTGALVELARTLVGSVTQTSLVFASVDGTTAESAGARELARHPPGGLRLRAGLALRGDRPARPDRAAARRRRASPARGGLAAHGGAGAARRGRRRPYGCPRSAGR